MYDFAHYIDKEHSTITGKSAYELAKDNGYVGTEAEWLESLSAYGVAKKGGYTGTLQEWLESLKAAGEWANANSRLTTLESSIPDYITVEKAQGNEAWRKLHAQMYYHNIFPRWREVNLRDNSDPVSQLPLAKWRAGDLSDVYVGDKYIIKFPSLNGLGMDLFIARIMQEDSGSYRNLLECVAMILDYSQDKEYGDLVSVAMNDTATTSGGYMGSKMYSDLIPNTYLPLFEELFGDHLIEHQEYLISGNTVNAGEEEPETQVSGRKLDLLTLEQVAGPKEIHNLPWVGNDALPLFQIPSYHISGNYWASGAPCWVQDVSPISPTTHFCTFNPYNNHFGTKAANDKGTLLFHFILY